MRGPSVAVLCLTFIVLSTAAPSTFAQTHSQKALQLGTFEQYVAYWTAEAGWKTELLLKNNLPSQALIVTPVLRTPNGNESALAPVTIHANDVVTVDLGQAITSGAPALAGAYGSMALRYSAPGGGVLLSAVMVELPGTPIELHLDGWLSADAKTASTPGSREGIWWLPRDSAKDWLIITNSAQSPATANLVLYNASGKSWQQKITLGARQMQRLSVRALVRQAGLTGSFGGIEIDLPNGLYSVDTAHFLYDEANGSLTLLKMFDHDPKATLIQRSLTDRQWTIRAPMLALSNPDPALALPDNTVLKPAILLRNASAKSYAAQLTFNWRSDNTKGKSATSVSLRPHETRLVDVTALQSSGTVPASARWAYVSISAPIDPDELLAVSTSFDVNGKLGAQTPFTDQVANYWEGGKWEVDANHNTLIAVGNAGTTASKTLVTFYYNSAQGKYEFEQTLGPDEQLWLDMGKLIGNQVPDRNGKTIPPDEMWGTYDIRSLTEKEGIDLFEGKLVVDKTFGYAVHGCGGCCAWGSNVHLYYNPMSVNVDAGEYQQVWATNSCTNVDTNVTGIFAQQSWWTGNVAIATAPQNAYIWGVAAGSTTQFAQGNLQSPVPPRTCPILQRNVQAPTNVAPKITGPNTLWFFKGLGIGVQGYSNQITLTSSPGSSYQWSITSGSDKVSLSGASQQVQVTSIGQSARANDVSITVTVAGQTSAPFYLTVRAPYALATDPLQPTPVYLSDPTYVWQSQIYYRVVDNLLTPMPVAVSINENWTTAVINDYQGTNWRRGNPGCASTDSSADFLDSIGGEVPTMTPTPVYNPNQNGPAVEHWGQEWRVGTCVIGQGPRVQTDTLQKYTDHARHTGITSPAP